MEMRTSAGGSSKRVRMQMRASIGKSSERIRILGECGASANANPSV